VSCVALLLALPALATRAGDRHPNILFILSDDQRYDTVHALGNPDIKTPTLDKLVGRGFVFTNPYCQGAMMSAVCVPSRTMIFTGKSLFRIPDYRIKKQDYGGALLATPFNSAGYDTLHVGKKSTSFVAGDESFTKVIFSSLAPEDRAAASQFHADAAIDFIREHRGPGARPFFIYLAPCVPHDPRVAPKEFMELYDPAAIPLPKSFMPTHPFDNGNIHGRDEDLAPHPRTPGAMKRHIADYYACITNLDYHVGRILNALAETGHGDDTIILFCSDHGLSVGGRHGLMGKQNLYEDEKVPLIFAGPGVPHGRSEALVYLFDLFPTLCDLAGVAVPAGTEGQSLVPVMRGERPGIRDTIFTAYKACQRAVRDRRWKLIKYNAGGQKHTQLFDLAADPDEVNNLAADPKYAAELSRVEGLLARARKDFGDNADFDGSGMLPEDLNPPPAKRKKSKGSSQ